MKKILVFGPLVILLIAVIAIFIKPSDSIQLPKPSEQTNSTNTPQPDVATVSGPHNSYTVNVPNGFVFENEGEFSRRIAKNIPPQGMGTPTFMYVSVIPRDQQNTEGTIYNYNPADFNKLVRSQPGSTVILGESTDQNLNSFFTYTHAEGRMVGGYGAKTFVNNKPWEFPGGTTEYRYIVEMTNAHYLIGGYLNTDTSSPGHISQAEFDQIINSIKITADNIIDTTPVTNGQKKTFSSNEHKVTFAYPADWETRSGPQSETVFSINKIGKTQRTETELYDGAVFSMNPPMAAPENYSQWLREHYNNPDVQSEPPTYSKYSINNINYDVVRTCGLGCYTHYNTVQNGKLYRFTLLATGPQEELYNEVLLQIINTITYLP